jgi:hypothetical protein
MTYGVGSTERNLSKYAAAIGQALNGRTNADGVVTLAANAATTTVNPVNCAAGDSVFLFPATADAAAALATTYVPAAAVTKQQFVIHHANNAQTDRTFFYVCLG